MKHNLRRVIGETRLTYEEITTLLAEVEACLNSRPLQALSDDPGDLEALTPEHFFIDVPLIAPDTGTVADHHFSQQVDSMAFIAADARPPVATMGLGILVLTKPDSMTKMVATAWRHEKRPIVSAAQREHFPTGPWRPRADSDYPDPCRRAASVGGQDRPAIVHW